MTAKQLTVARDQMANPGKDLSQSMKDAGYSDNTKPIELVKSDGWAELMETFLPDSDLLKTHQELLHSTYIDHMVFPLGMSDEEITDLLKSVNCVPKKFMHGTQAVHCWYWSADSKARQDALELAYKIKGRLKEGVNISGNQVAVIIKEGELDSIPLEVKQPIVENQNPIVPNEEPITNNSLENDRPSSNS